MYKFGINLLVAAMVLSACNRSGESPGAHDHDQDAEVVSAIQSTLFSDQYEYFIEYDPLSAGTSSGFLVHVTRLATYDPVTSGSLTVRVGNAHATADAPVRPGIFELEVVPGGSGKHEIVYSLQSGETTDLVRAPARVAAEQGHDDHAHEEETPHQDEDNALHDHDGGTAHTHEAEVSHAPGKEASHDHGEDAAHIHKGASSHEHAGDVPHVHEGEVQAEDGGHVHAAGALAEGEIIFLKEQAWKSDFMVREVSPVPFAAVVKASGKVLSVPGEKQHLAAHSSGMLVFRDKLLVQGSRVEKGQPLFVILATSLSDDNFEVRYRELRNNMEQSRSEYRRHEKLFGEQVISERQFIASKTKYENDSIRFRSLASKASADGLQITAPVSGTIHELNFSEGQYVETGDQLVTISSNEQLLLRADVPMQHYPLVGRIVTANFRTGYSGRIYNVEELEGSLLARGSSVAENDHFIPIYFEVTNDGTLLEGAFAEFFLKSGEQEQAIVVPAGAISEEQGVHYCYLQVTGESYTKKEVSVGETDGRYYQITTGLKKGDRVVTKGVMLLKAASMVTGDAGHGHAH